MACSWYQELVAPEQKRVVGQLTCLGALIWYFPGLNHVSAWYHGIILLERLSSTLFLVFTRTAI